MSPEEASGGKMADEERADEEYVLPPTESIYCEKCSVENVISIDSPYAADKETLSSTVAKLLCKTTAVDDSSEAGDVVTRWDTDALHPTCLTPSQGHDPTINVGHLFKKLFHQDSSGQAKACCVVPSKIMPRLLDSTLPRTTIISNAIVMDSVPPKGHSLVGDWLMSAL